MLFSLAWMLASLYVEITSVSETGERGRENREGRPCHHESWAGAGQHSNWILLRALHLGPQEQVCGLLASSCSAGVACVQLQLPLWPLLLPVAL